MMQWQETAPDVWTASTDDRVYTVTKTDGRWRFTCFPPPAVESDTGSEWVTLLDAQEEAEGHSRTP